MSRQAVFIPEKPIDFPKGAILKFSLHQKHGGDNSDDNQNHNLGRWRLSVSTDTNAVADTIPARVREALSIPRERRNQAQLATVFSHWRTTVPEFREVNDRIEGLWRQWPEGTPTLVMAMRTGSGPGEEPRPNRIFQRGDWLKPGRDVSFGTPSFLHRLPETADGSRLTLARWLTDRRSPTTARVVVNRVWQAYFGTGLVETPEDFGLQSPRPSHPELLDWLACDFMENGWSLKRLHRQIVSSETYQQSSRVTPRGLEMDPYNRFLARAPRVRVEAEIVRDIALSVSGLLNPELGGRGVYPPAPEFLFQPPASYGPKVWTEEKGQDRFRRSIYAFRFRSVPYPVLMNFDAPNGDFSCVRRLRSNTPLQALTTLNEAQFMEAARALAAQTLREGGSTDGQRVTYVFRRVLSRRPRPAEKAELLALLRRQTRRLAEGWLDAGALATGTDAASEPPPGTTPTQLAALTTVSRVLLNLDETITKE